MKQLAILSILLFFFLSATLAQNVDFERENFPELDDATYTSMIEHLESGNYHYDKGYTKYKLAIPYYLDVYTKNPNNIDLNHKIAVCYLYGSNFQSEALPFLEKVYKVKPDYDEHILYDMGFSYHLKGIWDKAITFYTEYEKTLDEEKVKEKRAIQKRISEAKSGYALKDMATGTNKDIIIENIGDSINTEFADYGAVINADASKLYYTSRNPMSTGGKRDPYLNEYNEDIYVSHFVNGKWTKGKNIGPPINSEEHESVVGLSADGQKMLIFINDNGNGNIYESVLEGEEWTPAVPLHVIINTPFHESSASYSFDGKTLYFISKRKDMTYGGRDIFYSEWDEEHNHWGTVFNIGPVLNTEFDEEAVFAHPDGKTIFFSSKGHNTMGGYDIFQSVKIDGQWTSPVNLGPPVNTPGDDLFFVLSAKGDKGFLTSSNPGGYGDKDIYQVSFLGRSKMDLTVFKGIVKDPLTGEALAADIEIVDNATGEIVYVGKSNAATGQFLVPLPGGKNYGVVIKSEGKLFDSQNFDLMIAADESGDKELDGVGSSDISTDKKVSEHSGFKEIEKEILLQPLKEGSSIRLNNIFFDYTSHELRNESKAELNNIVKLMKDNPNMKIEIAGHTDNQGTIIFDQQLSIKRALEVVNYIANAGIEENRLSYVGYGKSKPLRVNDSEQARQLNRRTEFKIISM